MYTVHIHNIQQYMAHIYSMDQQYMVHMDNIQLTKGIKSGHL